MFDSHKGGINLLFIHRDIVESVKNYFMDRCGLAWCFPGSFTGFGGGLGYALSMGVVFCCEGSFHLQSLGSLGKQGMIEN